MAFKKGDKVVVVKGNDGKLKLGSVHVVKRYPSKNGDDMVDLECPRGSMDGWYLYRFKPYVEDKPLKVGDLITVLKRDRYSTERMEKVVGDGLPHPIVKINHHHGNESNIYIDIDGWDFFFLQSSVERYKAPLVMAVGVEVTCVDAAGADLLRLNRKYVVEKIYPNGSIKVQGIGTRYHPRRFSLNPKALPKPPVVKEWEPKVGDVVFVTGPNYYGDNPLPKKTPFLIEQRNGQTMYLEGHPYNKTSIELAPPGTKVNVEKDLRAALYAKGKGGICSFAFETDKGVRKFNHNAPCHAALNSYGNKETYVAMAYGLRVEMGFAIPKKDPEAHKAYVNYVISQSPWKDAFITQDIEEAMTKDIFMNVNVNRYVMAGACVAVRVGSEKEHRAFMFKKFLDNGHNPHTCWIMSNVFSPYKGDTYSIQGMGGGHDVIDGVSSFDELIKFFKQGYHTKEGLTKEPFATHHSNYVIARAIAGTANNSLSKWAKENANGQKVGEGFYQSCSYDEQTIFDAATLIDNIFKEA